MSELSLRRIPQHALASAVIALVAIGAASAPADAARFKDRIAPVVSWTSPTEAATVSGLMFDATAPTRCEVSATDNVGVRKVVFTRDGGVALNTDTAAPFNCRLDTTTIPDGTHTLQATAYDAAGRAASATRKIVVKNAVSEPVTAPVSTGKSTWRPVGSPILSDSEAAARVRRSSFEPRPGNYTPNHTVPTAEQSSYFNAQSQNYQTRGLFSGNFTGTTDEIIQWVSWKWGLDEDIIRAVAAVESWWNQNAYGFEYGGGGIMSVRFTQNPGLDPIGMSSTASNVEVFAGYIRQYYDNHLGYSNWLNNVEHGQPYSTGDVWGSIGAWYAGRWHTAEAEWYIAKVKQYLADRVWETF